MTSEQRVINEAKKLRGVINRLGIKRTPGLYQAVMALDAAIYVYEKGLTSNEN